MGIKDGTLEMLFISPEERGKGLGKRLLQYGIKTYAVERVAVNEQNPQAKGFMNTWAFRFIKGQTLTNVKELLEGKETLVKGIKTKDRKSYNAVVKIGEKGYIDFISFSK